MTFEAILQALSPYLLLVTWMGVSLGIIWGALPGLSTTMAMGLLIGLSAGMSQDVAICFMLGVYTGSVFGGAISAVLINIPGTPDAVPTAIEGHALLAKKRRRRPGPRHGDWRVVHRRLGRHHPADRLYPADPGLRAQLPILGNGHAGADRHIRLPAP